MFLLIHHFINKWKYPATSCFFFSYWTVNWPCQIYCKFPTTCVTVYKLDCFFTCLTLNYSPLIFNVTLLCFSHSLSMVFSALIQRNASLLLGFSLFVMTLPKCEKWHTWNGLEEQIHYKFLYTRFLIYATTPQVLQWISVEWLTIA